MLPQAILYIHFDLYHCFLQDIVQADKSLLMCLE